MIRVKGLGGCEIQVGRRRVTLTTEVPFALAFYLAQRAGERLTRDEIAEALWGFKDPAKSRHSLRQTLYKLRQKGLPLDEGAEEIDVDPSLVESDVTRVLGAEWPGVATHEEVDAAAELLPGFSRRMATGFTEWLDGLRDRVAAAHRRGALAQITRARREARWADLERWAQQVLRTDPLNEEATFARAESAAMAGSKAMALEILDAYMAELGDHAPKIGLPASILRRRIAERQPEWVTRGPREVPLVGRTELMSRLTGYVEDEARGKGSGVLLWGAQGVGKTRLGLEARSFAEMRGFRTVVIRSDPSHAARPLSTLLALLPRVLELPGAAGCSPSNLAVVHRLAREGNSDDQLTPTSPGADAQERLLGAVRDLFRAVAEESRTLILLDDLHNTDDASVRLVAQLVAATSDARMVWILTSRSSNDRLKGLSVNESLRRLTVGPLSDSATVELASALADSVAPYRTPLDIGALVRASGGNPLFVRELSAADGAPPNRLPSTLQELMQERLSALATADLKLLQVVTLLGQLSTAARVSRVLVQPPRALLEAIESLEEAGMLRLGSSRTLDLHECWQTAVTDSFKPAARAVMALECAQQLESETGDDHGLDRLWRAADLFALAGETETARRLFAQCADRLIRMGVSENAAPVLERALGLASNAEDRVELLAQLARAFYYSGQLEMCARRAREAQAIAVVPSERTAIARTILQSFLVDSLTKLREDHRSELALLARLAVDESTPTTARLFACLFGIRVVFNDARSPLERTFSEAARAITARIGRTLLGQLVELVWTVERGDSAAIRLVVDSFESIPQLDEAVKLRSMTLRYRALALRWIGEHGEAMERAEQAYQLALAAGLQDEVGMAAELLSFILLDREDLDAAERWIERWREIESVVAYPYRTHSLLHATCRLHVQRGQHGSALGLYVPLLSVIQDDLLAKRRIADLATIAYAAANVGDKATCSNALDWVLPVVETEPVSGFLDYPVELTVRTLSLLDDTSRSLEVGRRYCASRLTRLPGSLPECCRSLRAIAATLS